MNKIIIDRNTFITLFVNKFNNTFINGYKLFQIDYIHGYSVCIFKKKFSKKYYICYLNFMFSNYEREKSIIKLILFISKYSNGIELTEENIDTYYNTHYNIINKYYDNLYLNGY